LGYFFNEPTKSSIIGEKLPNLVNLLNVMAPLSGDDYIFRLIALTPKHRILPQLPGVHFTNQGTLTEGKAQYR
jgi:hypothetical protein